MQLDHTALALIYTLLPAWEVNSALRCCRHWSLSRTTISFLHSLRSKQQGASNENSSSSSNNDSISSSNNHGDDIRLHNKNRHEVSISSAAYDTHIASQIIPGPFFSRETETLPWRQYQYNLTHCHALVRLHSEHSLVGDGDRVSGEGESVRIRGLKHRVWNHHISADEQRNESQPATNDARRFGSLMRWLLATPSSSAPLSHLMPLMPPQSIVLTIVDAQPHPSTLTIALCGTSQVDALRSDLTSTTTSLPQFHSLISSTRRSHWFIDFVRYITKESTTQATIESLRQCRLFFHQKESETEDSSPHSKSLTQDSATKVRQPFVRHAPFHEDDAARHHFFTHLLPHVNYFSPLKLTSLYVSISTGVSGEDWLYHPKSANDYPATPNDRLHVRELYLVNCVGSLSSMISWSNESYAAFETVVIAAHPRYGCYIPEHAQYPLRSVTDRSSTQYYDCLLDEIQLRWESMVAPPLLVRCQLLEDDGSQEAIKKLEDATDKNGSTLQYIDSSTMLLHCLYHELRRRFISHHLELVALIFPFLVVLLILLLTAVHLSILLVQFINAHSFGFLADSTSAFHFVNWFQLVLWLLAAVFISTQMMSFVTEEFMSFSSPYFMTFILFNRILPTVIFAVWSIYARSTLREISNASNSLAVILLFSRVFEWTSWSLAHPIVRSTRRFVRLQYQLRRFLVGTAQDLFLVCIFFAAVLAMSSLRQYFVLAACRTTPTTEACEQVPLVIVSLVRWIVSFVF